MANNNSRASRREVESKRKTLSENYRNLFYSQFNNSVKVVGLENYDLPKRYLLKTLIEKGGIGYDLETGLFLPFTKEGIDVYGLPKHYSLIGFNGYIVRRPKDKVVILRANDYEYSIADFIDMQIYRIVNIDLAIEQNLDAIKTMTLVEVPDQATLSSAVNLVESRKVGASLFYKNSKSLEGLKISATSTGAEYLGDKLMELRKQLINETYAVLGISASNTEKRERVQSIEVLANYGLARDFIGILIDTFNHDSEVGGLKLRLEGNTTLFKDLEIEMKSKEQEIKEGDVINE